VIISKTPLRMSFAGGGTDLPAYYRRFGGAVLSTAIDKYVYITVNRKFDDWVRVSYSKTEEVERASQVEHRLVRAALEQNSIVGGIEITSIADIPSRGTGLGSSSAFTVGLLHALAAFRGRYSSAGELARESCHIEIDVLGNPIGKQDQYAAAFGGMNLIRFLPDDSVTVEPVICDRAVVGRLQDSLLTFYAGDTRCANGILAGQSAASGTDPAAQARLHRMAALAHEMKNELQRANVDAVGEILHEGWMLKRELAGGITNPTIDHWYAAARQAGAIGGKLLGAGGGGFLVFFVSPARREDVLRALASLRPVRFLFEPEGSRIIFYHP
jgi:D-glycero-alpha-D-manno-heptose-7-phosphate kinase